MAATNWRIQPRPDGPGAGRAMLEVVANPTGMPVVLLCVGLASADPVALHERAQLGWAAWVARPWLDRLDRSGGAAGRSREDLERLARAYAAEAGRDLRVRVEAIQGRPDWAERLDEAAACLLVARMLDARVGELVDLAEQAAT